MKIVVIGGSGLIGSRVVERLEARGHQVVAASPNTGVNTITGEGLAEALAGTQVVIDVANSPSFEDAAVMDFFTTSGHNLLAAEQAAGVKHHVALSVVGTSLLSESGYFRAKIAQEELITTSPVPYSIVHSTQFFAFVKGIADAGTVGTEVHVAAVGVQPVSPDDVADTVVDVALGQPVLGTVEIAGPETFRLDDLVAKGLTSVGDTRTVVSDPTARYFGAVLSDSTLLPGEHATIGSTTYDNWLAQS